MTKKQQAGAVVACCQIRCFGFRVSTKNPRPRTFPIGAAGEDYMPLLGHTSSKRVQSDRRAAASKSPLGSQVEHEVTSILNPCMPERLI